MKLPKPNLKLKKAKSKTADPDQFKGLTASDVKQQAEAIKQFQTSQNPEPAPGDSKDSGASENSESHTEEESAEE